MPPQLSRVALAKLARRYRDEEDESFVSAHPLLTAGGAGALGAAALAAPHLLARSNAASAPPVIAPAAAALAGNAGKSRLSKRSLRALMGAGGAGVAGALGLLGHKILSNRALQQAEQAISHAHIPPQAAQAVSHAHIPPQAAQAVSPAPAPPQTAHATLLKIDPPLLARQPSSSPFHMQPPAAPAAAREPLPVRLAPTRTAPAAPAPKDTITGADPASAFFSQSSGADLPTQFRQGHSDADLKSPRGPVGSGRMGRREPTLREEEQLTLRPASSGRTGNYESTLVARTPELRSPGNYESTLVARTPDFRSPEMPTLREAGEPTLREQGIRLPDGAFLSRADFEARFQPSQNDYGRSYVPGMPERPRRPVTDTGMPPPVYSPENYPLVYPTALGHRASTRSATIETLGDMRREGRGTFWAVPLAKKTKAGGLKVLNALSEHPIVYQALKSALDQRNPAAHDFLDALHHGFMAYGVNPSKPEQITPQIMNEIIQSPQFLATLQHMKTGAFRKYASFAESRAARRRHHAVKTAALKEVLARYKLSDLKQADIDKLIRGNIMAVGGADRQTPAEEASIEDRLNRVFSAADSAGPSEGTESSQGALPASGVATV